MINLKETGMERALEGLSNKDAASIRADLDYYDEYYLTKSGNFIKAFRQEFVKDPHMNLEPIPKLRLIAYQAGASLDELEQVFEVGNVPIITRVAKGIALPGFNPILNNDGQPTLLIPIKINIPPVYSSCQCPFIRQMSYVDLPEIPELFRTEYSLRYRMVRLMFNECPEACFVYERDSRILGVAFNKIEGNELYMRQLFVRDGYRGGGIGSAIHQERLSFARNVGIKKARANIRGEISPFHERYNPRVLEEEIEYYVTKGV